MTEFTGTDAVRQTLVERRQEMGLTQGDVAKAMGTGQSYISVFERGGRSKEPLYSTVQRYAEALGLTLKMTLEKPPAVEEDQQEGDGAASG